MIMILVMIEGEIPYIGMQNANVAARGVHDRCESSQRIVEQRRW